MQSMGILNLPLCLSGVTHPISLSKEIADHDLRREAMKKQKSEAREALRANQEMGSERNHERVLGEERESEAEGDLVCILYDLAYMCLACTAKAA